MSQKIHGFMVFTDYSYLHRVLLQDSVYRCVWKRNIFDNYEIVKKEGAVGRRDSEDIEGQVVFFVEDYCFMQYSRYVIERAAKLRAEKPDGD